MNRLPAGWRQVALRDAGTWFGGGTPSKARPEFWTDGTVAWLSPKDMGADVIASTRDSITEAALSQSAARLVPSGSVAIVVRSGILERTVPVAVVPFATALNQDMKALVPRDDIDPRWIAWGLRSIERHLLDHCRKAGTTVASLDTRRLLDVNLPLTPLDEQRRVLDILEDHLSRLDAAAEALRVNTARASVLADAVIRAEITGRSAAGPRVAAALASNGVDDGDLIPLPNGWAWVRLGDLADVVGGVTKDSKRQSDPSFVDVPYLRVANVQRGRLDLSTVSTIRVPPRKAEMLRLLPGDVLLNEGGDRDKLGRGWVWAGQIPDCIHQNHVFRARVRDSRIDPLLLSWAANTIGGPWCDRNGTQSVNLASISLRKIRLMPIPVPPTGDQGAIVGRVKDSADATERLRTELQRGLLRAHSLRGALLDAAFSGRLTGGSSDVDLVEELAGV